MVISGGAAMGTSLLADIGGSKSRFALVNSAGAPARMSVIENDTVADLDAAVARYLEETGARPRAATFAVAGPVDGEEIALTNRTSWRLRRREFAKRFGFSQLRVLNDFEAIAWALPRLRAAAARRGAHAAAGQAGRGAHGRQGRARPRHRARGRGALARGSPLARGGERGRTRLVRPAGGGRNRGVHAAARGVRDGQRRGGAVRPRSGAARARARPARGLPRGRDHCRER